LAPYIGGGVFAFAEAQTGLPLAGVGGGARGSRKGSQRTNIYGKDDLPDWDSNVNNMAAERLPGGPNRGGVTTQQIREKPGTVVGGDDLPDVTGQWLIDGAGAIPGQIARQLRGRTFANFREFREEFWRLVEADPVLRLQFGGQNQNAMRKGYAPTAPQSYQTGAGGANRAFNLDHVDSLDEQLSVEQALQMLYDLDNLQVAAPLWNQLRR
jgi:hypothetical protein